MAIDERIVQAADVLLLLLCFWLLWVWSVAARSSTAARSGTVSLKKLFCSTSRHLLPT
jgi:hypothetical protein